jgi:hypothetical protein
MLATPHADALRQNVQQALSEHKLTSRLLLTEPSIKITAEGVHTDRVIITLDSASIPYPFLFNLVQTLTPDSAEATRFIETHVHDAISPSSSFMIGCDGKNIEYYVEHEGGQLRSYDAVRMTHGIYNRMPRVYHPSVHHQLQGLLSPPDFKLLVSLLPLSDLVHVFQRHHPDYDVAYHMSSSRSPMIKSVASELRQLALACNSEAGALVARFLIKHANDVLSWFFIGVNTESKKMSINVYVRPPNWYERIKGLLQL